MNKEFLTHVRCYRAFVREGVGVIESDTRPDRELMQGDPLTKLFRGAGIAFSRRTAKFGEVTVTVPSDQLHSAVHSLEAAGLTGTVTY